MISTVLIYHPEDGARIAELLGRRQPELTIYLATHADQVATHLPYADALLTKSNFPIDTLVSARRLRWIQLMAAGADRFTAAPHGLRGIRVTRLVGTFGLRIAEYVFAYLLAVHQGIPRVLQQQAERRWASFHPEFLRGKTLLLVGVGQVGQAIGALGGAFGMEVLGIARRQRNAKGLVSVLPTARLGEALRLADVVALSVPLTATTRGMFGVAEFEAMRPGSIFINVGRGAVVQEEALIEGLRRYQPAWAILDVFAQEPLPGDSLLWRLPNAIATPHLAGHTVPEEAIDAFCDNLARLRAGRRLRHVVNVKRGY